MDTVGVKLCAECNAQFKPIRRTQRWCSRKCRYRQWSRANRDRMRTYRNSLELPSRTCIECGASFAPTRRIALYCSERCGNRYRNRKWQQGNPDAVSSRNKRWAKANPDAYRESQRNGRHRYLQKMTSANPYFYRDANRDLKRRKLQQEEGAA